MRMPETSPGTTAGRVAADKASRRRMAVRLTGSGGMLAMFALFFAGTLGASEFHLGVLTGLCYVVGCVLAACAVRPTQLLPVVVTPPMLFAGALICVQVITAQGGVVSVAEGTLVTLGNAAPWLFAGTALATVIALARGLVDNVRTLRRGLRADSLSQAEPARSGGPNPADR